MPTPHDALFKRTFSDPAHAAPLLRTALPVALAERINWTSLERLPTHFIGEKLAARQTDLLFRLATLDGPRCTPSTSWTPYTSARVRIAGHEVRLILLFEHASQSDLWLVLRFVEYMLLIWKDFLHAHPKARLLPAIVPVVLHHSEHGWTSPVELHELIDLSDDLKRILAPYLLNHRIIVDDLSKQSDDAIRQRVQDELDQLVLLLFKNLRHTPDVIARLMELSSLIRQVANVPSGVAALETVIKYILTVTKADLVVITHLFTTQVSPEAGDLIMTTAQQLIQQGIEQGIEKGIEQGIEKGIAKGIEKGRVEKQRQTLAKLIQLRFTAPSAATLARLGAASEAELDLWTERILTAETLDDLFA